LSFKQLFLLCIFLFTVGCGVKGDPVAPKGSYLPSVLENYDDLETDVPVNGEKKE